MVLINIRSIRNKTDELFLFLEELGFPPLVAVTEHWLEVNEPFFVEKYTTIARYDRPSSAHGGTLILSRNNDFSLITKYDFLLNEAFFEFSIVYNKNLYLYIICIYRSPDSPVELFFQNLLNLLDDLPHKSRKILCGDFNINYDAACATQMSLVNIFESYGLSMHVNSPTRITKTSSTIIDYIVSDFSPLDVCSTTINAGLSDHEAVFTKFNIFSKPSLKSRRLGRIFSARNFHKFQNLCLTSEWYFPSADVDYNFNDFIEKLVSIFNKAFPLISIKPKHHKPWATKGIRISAKNMRSLLYIKKFATNVSVTQYITKYRVTYLKLIKSAKKAYYLNRLGSSKSVAKETWSIINDLRNRTHAVQTFALPDPENLNEYFVNVSKNITSTILSQKDPISYLPNSGVFSNSLFLRPIDKSELIQTINSIKSKSSCSTDGLSIKIFSNLTVNVLEILVSLINDSFERGKFPECLKIAIIIPLHKGGEKSNACNYRPIALLPVLSKIIERLIKTRLMSFLIDNNILSQNQFGFLTNKCTTDAMFSVLHEVYQALNNNLVTATVFCDYAKAFDCVNHDILIKKLNFYGIRGIPLNWFQSYLNNRKQLVRANDIDSSLKNIVCGVPQGSVLGPLLFLIFINDITNLKIDGKIFLFADDTSITWSNSTIASLHATITSDLLSIKTWSDSNLLSFNVDKTVALSYKSALQPLLINSSLISTVDSVKFLGIFLDSNLKWSLHIDLLSKKLASACYAIRSVSKELNLASSKLTYFSLFESHLRYGLPFWGSSTAAQLDVIFKLQKRAIRYLFGLRRTTHCRSYFKDHGILTLSSLYILETVCLIRKHMHVFPARPHHDYSTRNSNFDVYLPIPSSELVKKSILYSAKKLYNHLPLQLKSATSFPKFRKMAKAHLSKRPYYSVEEFLSD